MYCMVVASVISGFVLRSIVEWAGARSTDRRKFCVARPASGSDLQSKLMKRGGFPDIRGDGFRMCRDTAVAPHSGAVGAEQKQFQDVIRAIVFGRHSVEGQ